MRLSTVVGLAATVLLLLSSTLRGSVDLSSPTAFRDCDAFVKGNPRDLDAYRCYLVLARRYQQWDEAVRRLEALLVANPSDSFASLYLGALEADRGRARAESLYRTAANGFAAAADTKGEILARLSLASFLRQRGRVTEAEKEVELAGGAASGDPRLMARVWIERGFIAIARGEYGLARSQLMKAEAVVENREDYLIGLVLDGLGAVASAIGGYEEALRCFAKEAELYADTGDYYEESRVRYNMATLAQRMRESSAMSGEAARRFWFDALDAAMRAHNLETQAAVYCLQAQDRDLSPSEALEPARRALEAAHATGNSALTASAARLVALNLLLSDPRQTGLAFEIADRSLTLARMTGSPSTLARGWLTHAYMRIIAGDHQKALEESLAALAAIERIRDLQRDEIVRARLFSEWAFAYYQLSGYLLASPANLPAAFTVTERMRARVLLDALDAARSTEALSSDSPLESERRDVLDQIARLQLLLAAGEMPERERGEAVERLEAWEAREASLREEIARANPRFAVVRHPDIPEIEEVQQSLAADEMLLSFQLADRERLGGSASGGSWLIAITRQDARAYSLPDRPSLDARVEMFAGMIGWRDGREAAAAAALHRDLIEPALRAASSGTRRLIIVPDGVLHRLPFGALRASPERPPLVSRYYLSLVPSVTVWLRWLKKLAQSGDRSAIVFADPDLGREGRPPAYERARLLRFDELPGALPFARVEGQMIVQRLGDRSRLLEGRDATEARLKQVDLGRYRILHLATHIVIDEANPERSAVLLAPGPPTEDGLLQSRDIVGLHLNGQTVMLFGCKSATGSQLRGEGVMGIARAFLQAGARAVVGSLWPLRDAEANELSEALYGQLAEGRDLASALAAAQRIRLSDGAPAAAWAGLVVIGDGGAVPVPGGNGVRSKRHDFLLFLSVFTIIAVIATLTRGLHRAP